MPIKILDVRKGDNRFAVTSTEGWSEIEFGKTKTEAIEIARKYDKMRYSVIIMKGYSKGEDSYAIYIKK